MDSLYKLTEELLVLSQRGNLRTLPHTHHVGRRVEVDGVPMLNLSSNDYLGLATDVPFREQFLARLTAETFLPSASSSRLLTGNFSVYDSTEALLAARFRREAALIFNSGYHMNTGILPAIADSRTLILADKLVHASIIDGICLSSAHCIRYRHNHYEQLETLLRTHHNQYDRVVVVTESIFSMDGDEADLRQLVALKGQFPNVLLYVDEAHAIGVRGESGLGLAEEQGVIPDIDFLCGTMGKALASVGGYVVCSQQVKEYLVNRMRTLIFTTALPPINLMWTSYVLEQLPTMQARREHLRQLTLRLHSALREKGYENHSQSHIQPMLIGDSHQAVRFAQELQRRGFYLLAVRPPTVPEGTARIRFSLTASLTTAELDQLIAVIPSLPADVAN